MSILFFLLFNLSTAWAAFSEDIALPDIVIESDGKTKNLGSLTAPKQCAGGSFSMTIGVVRKSGTNDVLFSVIDENRNRFDFRGGETKILSHLPQHVTFHNFSIGDYDDSCRCRKNPGSSSLIKITNIQFHPKTGNENCSFKLEGKFYGGHYGIDSSEFGNSFKNIPVKISYQVNIPNNFFKSGCNQLWIRDANKKAIFLDPQRSMIDVTLPAYFFQDAVCVSPRKRNVVQPDYSIEVQVVGGQK